MSEPGVRPPSFLRRHLAANADSHEILVGLACDENMWVRRQAVQNPATPRWVLDLLERAGADRGLRGRRDPDPDMAPSELRRLVECGPWAQQLVADHPNATAEILDALAPHPNDRIRRAVSEHVNTAPATLALPAPTATMR